MAESARLSALTAFLLKHRAALTFKPVARGRVVPGATPSQAATEFTTELEQLGPTFIKIGQTLSTRPDLLPPDYIAALVRLREEVEPVPLADIERTIESELGFPTRKIFTSFDPVPLGSASFAQVHSAVLPSGRRVAVKVQRPDLAQRVDADLAALGKLIGSLDLVAGLGRRYGFTDWLDEFRATLTAELDYIQEANNLDTFHTHLAPYPRLGVPAPIWDYTTTRVLTMELAEGLRVTAIPGVMRTEADLKGLAEDLGKAYLDQIFIHGLVHADPHPGNMLLTPDQRLVLLDLGMVGYIAPRMRDQLLKLVIATVDGRGEQAAETYSHMGTRLEQFDEPRFTRDIGRLTARYANGGGSESDGQVLTDLVRIGAECGLRPPAELTLLAKTLLNLEHVVLALEPTVSMKSVMREHHGHLFRARAATALDTGRLATDLFETEELLRDAPGRLSVLLRTLADNRLRIHVAGLEESKLIENMQKIANRITAGVIAAAMVIGAALIMDIPTRHSLFGYPALALVMFLIATLLGGALVLASLLGDRRAGPQQRRDPL